MAGVRTEALNLYLEITHPRITPPPSLSSLIFKIEVEMH